MAGIGEKIRGLRQARDLIIADLAETAGVSKSLISQIEREEVSPSLLTLRKISAALNIPITEFFEEGQSKLNESDYIVRKATRKKLSIPGANAKYELLSPNFQGKIEYLLIEVLSSKDNEEPYQFSHQGEECAFVLEGEVFVTLGEKVFHLTEGDSICFDSGTPHSLENRANNKALIITAITPPNF